MVIEIVSRAEFRERIEHLLSNTGLSAERASREMGKSKSFFADLLRSDRLSKVDPHKALEIAQFVAGRGRLVDDSTVLFNFLLGIEPEYTAVVRPRPRAVGDNNS